jgi:16S rRNA (cytosine1402-N4)-methyltransferase
VEHQPALAAEVIELLLPALEHGGVVVDATVGGGGHAGFILEAAPGATLVGIDRDPDALVAAQSHLAAHSDRVRLARGNFAQLETVLERFGIASVRGVLLDLGVSSPQLDEAARGFSFRHPGPLDMRMDPGQALSAEAVVNGYSEQDLAGVIRLYGEERFAARIAKAIVRHRPVGSTKALADVVKEAIPAPARRRGGHPARRTFQAIRIVVNDEIRSLEKALPAAVNVCEPGGRILVLSYHSLEDRIVKRFFADEARGCICPPDLPVCRCGAQARVRVLTRRPITASSEEVARNPRASAAKLRAAERVTPEEAPLPQEIGAPDSLQQKRSA